MSIKMPARPSMPGPAAGLFKESRVAFFLVKLLIIHFSMCTRITVVILKSHFRAALEETIGND
jgi:hypothetical protein